MNRIACSITIVLDPRPLAGVGSLGRGRLQDAPVSETAEDIQDGREDRGRKRGVGGNGENHPGAHHDRLQEAEDSSPRGQRLIVMRTSSSLFRWLFKEFGAVPKKSRAALARSETNREKPKLRSKGRSLTIQWNRPVSGRPKAGFPETTSNQNFYI
jgi:hypothetical protein